MSAERPSVDRLRRLLEPDFEAGTLRWREGGRRRIMGAIAGCLHASGYHQVQIDGKKYGAHRVLWALAHGQWQPDGMQIDHINGLCADNRLINLRLATPAQNQANRRNQTDHAAPKGVRLHKCGKWEARVRTNGRSLYLGLHATAAEAKAAYDTAHVANKGEFARP